LPSDSALYVNRDPGTRYFIEKDRDAGERDLRRLIGSSEVEESWLYVEFIERGTIVKRWYETGRTSGTHSVSGSLGEVLGLLTDRRVVYASDYHFHPARKDGGWDMRMDFIPSPDDLDQNLRLNEYLRKNGIDRMVGAAIITRAGKFTFAVSAVSEPGSLLVDSFEIANRAIQRLNECLRTEFGLCTGMRNLDWREIRKIIEDYCMGHRALGVEIRYEPLSQGIPEERRNGVR
jgi:hypothetical protein